MYTYSQRFKELKNAKQIFFINNQDVISGFREENGRTGRIRTLKPSLLEKLTAQPL